jgi:hypothetical protein
MVTAEELLQELRARGTRGMTRTEIRDYFSRHGSMEITLALNLLGARGLVWQFREETRGRPATRWISADVTDTARVQAVLSSNHKELWI